MATDQFFRELTLRICSTLDIQKAIERVFPVLRARVPLDELRLEVLDRKLGAVRQIARVSTAGQGRAGERITQVKPAIIPLPARLWRWADAMRGPILMDEASGEDMRMMRVLTKAEHDSDLAVPLRVESTQLGFLLLRAAGKGRYTAAHAELLATVADPCAVALANALAHQELVQVRDELLDDKRFLNRELFHATADEVIGGSTGLRSVMELVRQAAPLNSTVLLLGETGVGKDVIANVLHDASPRREGPFIKVNCGAIPEGLVDSEMFGHEAGAFTGARAAHRGRFERADGGTIFLDEIGDLPKGAQVRLLRVLQSREIERVGGTRPLKVDIRVIAATHQNLQQMVTEGRFREDLFFRLNVLPINIPPLRLRAEDIPALVRHFVAVKRRGLGIRGTPTISPGALARLQAYAWPGNVRELENVVERELVRSAGRGRELSFEELARSQARSAPSRHEAPPPRTLADVMAAHIEDVLAATGGKIHGPGGAAELLGVNESTLRNRMNRLGITYGRAARKRREAG
ncbi:sigma-54-dependent Fis family transcriptional regulator [Anaeromyxobacter dehalogenans]|uniref:DNA-binding protein Fis n=1 Tax=Anaeromyxobacter dehalogenans (strain 2CP-C) TaxID=290397 RepID=Q2IEG0_ANADE|nr:sigma 54-interacting transcriptional regulator [Anaeromyxobacter dehalogenans]ABC82967.1 DNA-binding protein Fis [Anaeromyxobacter dehalogenans 2CP-C]